MNTELTTDETLTLIGALFVQNVQLMKENSALKDEMRLNQEFVQQENELLKLNPRFRNENGHIPLPESSLKMTTDQEIDAFIRTLAYPKFAAYVVNRLCSYYGISRTEAEQAWLKHQSRVK